MTVLSRRFGAALGGVGLGAAAVLAPVLAVPAAAHVTANPNEATSPYFRTTLRVGHGCAGSPTVSVRVQIPEGVQNARAEVVTGWDVEVVREELDEPIEGGHGEQITDRVAELAWVGGSLSDEQFQEFGVSFRITDDAPEVLWLPTIQECEDGEHRWIEIPSSVEEWGDVDEPAPYVINSVGGAGRDAEPDGDDSAGDEVAAEATGAESGTGTDPVAVIALVVGLLGVGIGVGGILYAHRRTSVPS